MIAPKVAGQAEQAYKSIKRVKFMLKGNSKLSALDGCFCYSVAIDHFRLGKASLFLKWSLIFLHFSFNRVIALIFGFRDVDLCLRAAVMPGAHADKQCASTWVQLFSLKLCHGPGTFKPSLRQNYAQLLIDWSKQRLVRVLDRSNFIATRRGPHK